ncbi:YchJ family protein [Granulosicoccaceae sp. 1_MG-2023]|nr:YchJ family protein [Granulosicoccaceae sp. 1_MG-2023]
MSNCPCGSAQPYENCCAPLIKGEQAAATAEQLMRARYTAHTLADIGFIVSSHHPDTRHEIDEASTRQWAEKSEWLGIDIRHIEGGSEADEKAEIEFVVNYRDAKGERRIHHELSEFEKKDGQWFFRDAKAPTVEQYRREEPKLGRNDPCHCGSGKKYKKCCGKAA